MSAAEAIRESKQHSAPLLDENRYTLNELTLEGCQRILTSYQTDSNLSIFKEAVTGISYNGEDSTNIIRDLLAGGATNNLFFKNKSLKRSPYAMIAMLIDEIIYRNDPRVAVKIFRQFTEAKNLRDIQQFVKDYREYLPSKCYYDLQNDFEFSLPEKYRKKVTVNDGDCPEYTTNNLDLARQRKAESESDRLSKIMLTGYALGEGFIEMMGMSGFSLVLSLSGPGYIILMAAVFIVAAYINYSFGREDTTQFIQRWKMGNTFKRKIIETTDDGEIILYKKFTCSETMIVCGFAFLSLSAAFCVFVLGLLSMSAAYPILAAGTIPLLLLVPTSLIFTNMVYKYIDNNGLEGIKKYFDSRFKENWIHNKPKVIYEAFKLFFSIAISVIVCIATFLLLRGKAITALSKTSLIFAAPVISSIAAVITAGVKALFSVSKIGELLDIMGGFIFQSKKEQLPNSNLSNDNSLSESEELTAKIFEGLKRKKQFIRRFKVFMKLSSVLVHATAEGGLVKGELDKEVKAGLEPTITPLKESVLIAGKFAYSGGTTANAFAKIKNKELVKYCDNESKYLRM